MGAPPTTDAEAACRPWHQLSASINGRPPRIADGDDRIGPLVLFGCASPGCAKVVGTVEMFDPRVRDA